MDIPIIKSTIKRKWFDMILSGEKKEEYKDIKKFWQSRLKNLVGKKGNPIAILHLFNGRYLGNDLRNLKIEILSVNESSNGKVEWGFEPENKKFVISLGKIIEKNNC